MKLSDIFTLVRRITKTAPVRYSGQGLFDEPEYTYEVSAQRAGELINVLLDYYKIKQGYITITDLVPLLKMAGREREWLHLQIQQRLDTGVLYYDETRNYYEIMI